MHSFSILSITSLLLAASPIAAKPYLPLVQFLRQASRQNASLELRDCVTPCGWEDQYCCASGQTCTTSANVALCVAGSAATAEPDAGFPGSYQLYTTTYIEVDSTTVTSTGSYLLGSPVQTPVASPGPTGIQCNSGEQSCGTLCCAANQVCGAPNQCIAATGSATASQSAFIRPTSNTVATITAAATTTVPFTAPVNSGGASVSASPVNNGLSPGAIAGIVIGVLVGLFLLFIILGCLCCKGIIDAMLALFGCRKRRKVEETTIIESRHSHHSGRPPPPRRTWYGMVRPARPEVVVEEKKKSSGLGWLGMGGLLAGLAIMLGLKRRHDRKENEHAHSYYSNSYYSYSESDYTTSKSSASTRGPRSARSGPARSAVRSGSRR